MVPKPKPSSSLTRNSNLMTMMETTPMRETLNSRAMPKIQTMQSFIDMMGEPERAHYQGILDRMCDKIDALPGMIASQLDRETDRTRIMEVLQRECANV